MVGFSVFRSHAINNIENYYGGLVSVRNAINNFAKAGAGLGVETIQKIKESEGVAEALLSSINIFKKSKAYIVYEKFKDIYHLKRLDYEVDLGTYEIYMSYSKKAQQDKALLDLINKVKEVLITNNTVVHR